jgi:DNA-binding MarR family transcriptional regulator
MEGIEQARQWQSLIGTNGIETRADLAKYLGISRARVTQVLRRLSVFKSADKKGSTSS